MPMPQAESKDLWLRLLSALAGRGISRHVQDLLGQLRPVASPAGKLTLRAPNPFIRDWIQDNYGALLADLLADAADGPLALDLLAEVPPTQAPVEAQAAMPPSGLNPDYTFMAFVLGKSNELVFSAAQAVARQPGAGNNPLFIYGDSGLGKTHILHAIGNEVLRLRPKARVRLVNGEQFMNEYIAVAHAGKMIEKREEFRRKYREECDVLLLDDIQLWRGSAVETRHEFFLTFNELHEKRRQIVITSDRPPSDLPDLEERLKTRFHHGLLADIQPPAYETRMGILLKKAEALRTPLPDEVAAFIAERVRKNVRELEGALHRLVAVHDLMGLPITLEMAQDALRNILPPPPVVNLDSIIEQTARYFDISLDRLIRGGRLKRIAHGRAVAMYLCRTLTTASFPEIGARFEKDHATVMYACRKITRAVEGDLTVRREIAEIRARVTS